jgi:hypothetical protein
MFVLFVVNHPVLKVLSFTSISPGYGSLAFARKTSKLSFLHFRTKTMLCEHILSLAFEARFQTKA